KGLPPAAWYRPGSRPVPRDPVPRRAPRSPPECRRGPRRTRPGPGRRGRQRPRGWDEDSSRDPRPPPAAAAIPPRRSEAQAHPGDRSLELLAQAQHAVAAGLVDIQAEPLVAQVHAEAVGPLVVDQRAGPREVTVVVVEIAPVRVQVLALHDEQPAVGRAVGQARADHRRKAVGSLARRPGLVADLGAGTGLDAGVLHAQLQAPAQRVGLHHGEVVGQAGDLELDLAPDEAARRDGLAAIAEVLFQGPAAVLVVVEVVEQQPMALAHAEL